MGFPQPSILPSPYSQPIVIAPGLAGNVFTATSGTIEGFFIKGDFGVGSPSFTDIAGDAASKISLSAVGTGVNGNAAVAKAGAIATPTAPSAAYVQAEAQSMKVAVDALRVAVQNFGITV